MMGQWIWVWWVGELERRREGGRVMGRCERMMERCVGGCGFVGGWSVLREIWELEGFFSGTLVDL